MNSPLLWLEDSLANRVGWAVLHSVWQGAVIGLIFAFLRYALQRHSANTRYVVGCLALTLMMAAPLAILLPSMTPSGQIHGVSSHGYTIFSSSSPTSASQEVGGYPREAGAITFFRWFGEFCGHLAPVLAIMWLGGVVFCWAKLTRSWLWVRKLRSRSIQPVEIAWIHRMEHLKIRLQISRPVRLFKSALIQVPTVIGWLRPVILMPAASFSGLTVPQLEAILAHELAHVRRFDYLMNTCQCLVETLMFYHPVVWWISNCIREERENCCDDLVVRICGDPLGYARALATLEYARADLPELAFAANGGSLLGRIRRLMGGTDANTPSAFRQISGLAMVGMGMLLIIFGIYLSLKPNTYTAVTRFKVDEGIGAQAPNAIAQTGSYNPYFIQTEFEVIRSEPVLQRVIETLNLHHIWGQRYSDGKPLRKSESISLLRNRMELRVIRNTNLIEVRVRTDQAKEAEQLANTIARAFQELRAEQRKALVANGIRALEEQFQNQQQKTSEAQRRVDELKKELKIANTLLLDDGSVAIIDSQAQLIPTPETTRRIETVQIETRTELAKQQALLSALKGFGSEQLGQVIPTVAPDTLLTSLIEQRNLTEQTLIAANKEFGANHPEVARTTAQLQDLEKKIVAREQGIMTGMELKVVSLKEALKNLEQERAASERKAEAARPYFEAKRTLDEERRVSEVLAMKLAAEKIDRSVPQASVVEILDLAVLPLRPISPNRPAALGLIFLGLVLDLAGLRLLRGKRVPSQ
jgi:beta-lactamase regulating signal transducer with metallopeptidase domain/uncharacterized protein involved in exopolysaccharide biosynthesis